VNKPEKRGPLRSLMRIWGNSIKIDLNWMGRHVLDLCSSDRRAVLKTVMDVGVP
jgi:hypothetical protein